MSDRKLPVRPSLEQLRDQARDLHRAIQRGEPEAIAELREHSPGTDPAAAKLSDAQHVLARRYQASDWARLVHACDLIDAIWRDDVDAAMALVIAHPDLHHGHATIRMLGGPKPPEGALAGPAYTLSVSFRQSESVRVTEERGGQR